MKKKSICGKRSSTDSTPSLKLKQDSAATDAAITTLSQETKYLCFPTLDRHSVSVCLLFAARWQLGGLWLEVRLDLRHGWDRRLSSVHAGRLQPGHVQQERSSHMAEQLGQRKWQNVSPLLDRRRQAAGVQRGRVDLDQRQALKLPRPEVWVWSTSQRRLEFSPNHVYWKLKINVLLSTAGCRIRDFYVSLVFSFFMVGKKWTIPTINNCN